MLGLSYINDISCDLTNNVRLFADVTSLYIVVDQDIVGDANSLTNDLGKLDRWSKQWLRGSFKKYVDNVAVERKKFLKIKFNTWKDSKSYILSTSDVSIN